MIFTHQKTLIYESNDQTTTGPVCRRNGADAFQLAQAVPQRTLTDGTEAQHEGAATPHREMDSRAFLHRSGNVVTRLATFFRLYSALYA